MSTEIDELVETYAAALRDQNAAIFAGAGLSVASGFVDWKNLLHPVAKDLGLDVDREQDLIALAQYHKNERGGRHRLNTLILQKLVRESALSEGHRILARLPIRTYWTTNYDQLIERALKDARKTPDVKISRQNLAQNVPRADAVVYKMHGDVQFPEEAVITKDDYEAYNNTRQLFSTSLQGDLVSKTFLFLGFSFSDPNLDYILSRIRVLLEENRRDHYCLLRKVQRNDFGTQKDFAYARTKQELRVRDLRRYGIIGVLVDDYDNVTKILERIERRYRRNSVFISGSADTYAPFSERDATKLIEDLAAALIREGFQIVSGFGRGVGSAVINGVLHELENERSQSIDDRLILRPFPQHAASVAALKAGWRRYREDMIPRAGIALFLFGNKYQNDVVVEASGVFEEFEIAHGHGVAVVPVGATGYASNELHKRVRSDFATFFGDAPLKRDFARLSSGSDGSQIVQRALSIARKIRDLPD